PLRYARFLRRQVRLSGVVPHCGLALLPGGGELAVLEARKEIMIVSDSWALQVVLAISVVTIFLRVIPFAFLSRMSSSGYLLFLREKMPTGVMILLVAYTLKDQDLTVYPYGLPDLGALLIAVVLYWTTRNSLLSIGLALAGYMVAVNLLI